MAVGATTLAAEASAQSQLPDDHGHQDVPSDLTLRVKALESLLVEKGLVDPAALDAIVDHYEHKVGPRNGARVVARAWSDPAYLERLRADATAAIAELDFTGRQGEHMIAVENTPDVHNLVVCTLCSCYPWPVLGLPPVWYKSAPYRSRAVIDPRGVLAEVRDGAAGGGRGPRLGFHRRGPLPGDPGTAGRNRVTAGRARSARLPRRHDRDDAAVNGVHDMGGMHGMGPVAPEPGEPVFHHDWEARVHAMTLASPTRGNIDAGRHRLELLPPADYLRMSYYEKWLTRLELLLVANGFVTAQELTTGRADRKLPRRRPCGRRTRSRPR